jgi:hypothetical protein
MIKLFSLIFTFSLLLTSFGCQTTSDSKTGNQNNSNILAQPSKPQTVAVKSSETIIDVPKLANQSIAELDKMFGTPDESKKIENGGEYRLYKIAGHSKGLAVRFYGGKAKSFNLISDKSLPTSKEALKQIFSIDVGNVPPTKDPKETLSETYQGSFGGVKFTKVSAKKQANGSGFVFVLAETAN